MLPSPRYVRSTSARARVIATYANLRSSACSLLPASSSWVRYHVLGSTASMLSPKSLAPRILPNISSSISSTSSSADSACMGSCDGSTSCGNRGRISRSTRIGTGTAVGSLNQVFAVSEYSGGIHPSYASSMTARRGLLQINYRPDCWGMSYLQAPQQPLHPIPIPWTDARS